MIRPDHTKDLSDVHKTCFDESLDNLNKAIKELSIFSTAFNLIFQVYLFCFVSYESLFLEHYRVKCTWKNMQTTIEENFELILAWPISANQ